MDALAAAAVVGLGKGAAAPAPAVDAPSGEALYARLRRMTDREMEGEAGRGRVVE